MMRIRIAAFASTFFLLQEVALVASFASLLTESSRRLRSGLSPLPAVSSRDDDNNSNNVRTSESFSIGSGNSGLSMFRNHNVRNKQQRDVVIVGGALAGLSAALYLSQMDPSRHITILDREEYGKRDRTTTGSSAKGKNAQPASFAAAGMLAPQSERLPPGHLLDLCVSSRKMFPDFCDMVESLAQESGEEGAPYLYDNQFHDTEGDCDTLDPWSVGYVASGGFLAPAFAGDAVATFAPPEDSGAAIWLDAMQVRELEPVLHPDVVGGWWFPDDASVDARRLTCSLRAACVTAGIQILAGPQYEVSSLDLVDGKCQGMWLQPSKTKSGQRYIRAKTVLIANGAWMRHLLPVPIEPHKGQSLSLRMPKDRPPILRRVLFAQDTYIVPKADGRIVIGATVEAGSYDPNVTPAGLMHIMTHALQLVPALKDLPVEETWAGLRPTTPDKGPILGKTPWSNLFVAGGYWRNGVLLAPKTGQLIASLIVSSSGYDSDETALTTEDEAFLEAFAWDRFTTAAGSTALSANARYAASMHPIHRRSSTGRGVSAAVGSELGSYSSARAAVDERKQDRDSLWSGGSSDDTDAAFERAAAQGKQDATAYSFGESEYVSKDVEVDSDNGESSLLPPSSASHRAGSSSSTSVPSYYMEGAADALTVGAADSNDERNVYDLGIITGGKQSAAGSEQSASKSDASDELSSLYKMIQDNKAKRGTVLVEGAVEEERPDPGFRVYHVDPNTGATREVPPYTSPGDFLASIAAEKQAAPQPVITKESENGYSETTYDGYQDIQQANSRQSRPEELEAMRESRRRNRLGQEEIDYTKIGAQRTDKDRL